jgi:predicted aspartyl protease
MRRTIGQALVLIAAAAASVASASGPQLRAPEALGDVPAGRLVAPAQDADGYDRHDLKARYPEADVLPLIDDRHHDALAVAVVMAGHEIVGEVDTGAGQTSLGEVEARAIGLLRQAPVGEIKVSNRLGDSELCPLYETSLTIGRWRFPSFRVAVTPGVSAKPLIGIDVLQHVDLLLAEDVNALLLFEPGALDAVILAEDEDHERELEVLVGRYGRPHVYVWHEQPGGRLSRPLLFTIDTGASQTTLPWAWLQEAEPVAEVTVTTFKSKRRRTLYDPGAIVLGRAGLRVAPMVVGGTPQPPGLLGMDVLRERRAALSMRSRSLRVFPRPRRPATRLLGPGGASCNRGGERVPCLATRIDRDDEGAALCVVTGPPWRGRRLGLKHVGEGPDGHSLWAGGGSTLYLQPSAPWDESCFSMPSKLATSPRWRESRLELTWVFAPAPWPCDRGEARRGSYRAPL